MLRNERAKCDKFAIMAKRTKKFESEIRERSADRLVGNENRYKASPLPLYNETKRTRKLSYTYTTNEATA